jgi:hypothetical protein
VTPVLSFPAICSYFNLPVGAAAKSKELRYNEKGGEGIGPGLIPFYLLLAAGSGLSQPFYSNCLHCADFLPSRWRFSASPILVCRHLGNGHGSKHTCPLVPVLWIVQGLLAHASSRRLINIKHCITLLRQELDWEAGKSPAPCSQIPRHMYVLQLVHGDWRCESRFLFQICCL